jgi:lysophospholipase L1-like esterase
MKRTVLTAASALMFSALTRAQTPAPTPDQIAVQRRAQQEQLANDWANLARYRDANRDLPPAVDSQPRVVFMGDSITELWDRDSGKFFASQGYIGRGISGQTTPQMLIRFQQDVVALKPKVVVINAGTNDIAGNTGPSTLEMIEDNLKSMAQIATANGIYLVLASVTPAYDYPWKRGLEPAEKVVALNSWMKGYCARTGCVYADYFTPMSDEKHGMREGLSRDGIHPTPAGYAIMAPIAQRAIAQALGRE